MAGTAQPPSGYGMPLGGPYSGPMDGHHGFPHIMPPQAPG